MGVQSSVAGAGVREGGIAGTRGAVGLRPEPTGAVADGDAGGGA